MFKRLLIGFGLFFIISIPVVSQDKTVDKIIAVVGGNIILKSDIEELYMNNMAQGITTSGDMKCEALEQLLMEKLYLAEAELDSTIIVTQSQLYQYLDQQMEMILRNFGSEKNVENFYGRPIAQVRSNFEDVIHNHLMSNQMVSKITRDVKITPAEVRYFYRNLDPDKIPMISEELEYSQIAVFPIITLEEENAIKARLREYKSKIENGENTFFTMAVLYSQDGSSQNGGEIGYRSRTDLDPAYATVAFTLREGRISNVVKSDFGYHIIQLIGRQGEKINTRHIIIIPKPSTEAMENAKNDLDSLTTLIRRQIIPFETAALHYSSDKNSRSGGGLVINPETLSSKWKITELEPDVSKVLTTLKENEISDPFLTVDDKNRPVYKVVKLISRTKQHKANIQDDYQFLSRIYQAQKEEEAISKWINTQQSKTYIHLDETYTNCNFKFSGWIK